MPFAQLWLPARPRAPMTLSQGTTNGVGKKTGFLLKTNPA